jgi:hypothetical protein
MKLKNLSIKAPHDVLPVDGRLTIFGISTDPEWQCINCGTVNPSPDSECPGKQEDEE